MTPLPSPNDRIAYLGRVSSPKQKLEHQREAVLKFAIDHGLHLPKEAWFEDKVRRHKQLTEGEDFARLMELCRAGQFDWIIIATFDRWGIKSKDDIFVFRRMLSEMDVRLWSVADELEITGEDDASFWRVAARAEGATSYVAQQAQKNIQKMLSMAQLGLAGTGNAPYAVDLVCYPLIGGHAPDLSKPLFRVVRKRYIRPSLYEVIYPDGREEITEKMPLRDKKLTGYRYEKSLDDRRLTAVNRLFEFYDAGMSYGEVSEALDKQGFLHYDKPFGAHGVESILKNPIYIGLPAWGKSGVGQYYLAMNGQAVKANRKSKDPFVVHKTREHYTQPPAPIWDPIVPVDLWERVQARLDNRAKEIPAVGMRRQRSTVKHPLNGKVVCPGCGERMVMGSSQSKGYIKRYFICGLYRRTIRKKCQANSIPFNVFDEAVETLLETVKGRIDALTGPPSMAAAVLKEEWAKRSELGRILAQIVNEAFRGAGADPAVMAGHLQRRADEGRRHLDRAGKRIRVEIDHEKKTVAFDSFDDLLRLAIKVYNAQFAEQSEGAEKELAKLETELGNATEAILAGIPSETVRRQLNARMSMLEDRKRQLTSSLVPLTVTAEALGERLKAIRSSIVDADAVARGRLLDDFLERVEVAFEGEPIKGHGRPIALTFVPKEGKANVLGEGLKLVHVRRGRDSSPRPGRIRPGMSCCARPD